MKNLYEQASGELNKQYHSKPHFPICLDIQKQYNIEVSNICDICYNYHINCRQRIIMIISVSVSDLTVSAF